MPEENAVATESVPEPQSNPHRKTPKHIFWGRRVLEALVPGATRPKRSSHPRRSFNYNWLTIIPVAVFIVVTLAVMLMQLGLQRPSVSCPFKIPKPVKGTIPGRPVDCVRLEVAQTESALIRGLSGRQHMERDRGMLFKFEQPDRYCMWMKDMHFSLDMLWLDENQSIVHIKKDVSPDTYPQTFCGPDSAKYVVEINAGIADAAGLQVGQRLKL